MMSVKRSSGAARRIKVRIPVFALALYLVLAAAGAGQHYQEHFPPEEFAARRAKVFEWIGDQAVAVLQGAPDPGGFIYPRQSNVFYYLSGVENPYAYLLLDGRTKRTTLFLSGRATGRGERVLSLDKPDIAKTLTGVDDVQTLDKLGDLKADVIYTMFAPAEGQAQTRGNLRARDARILNDPWDGRLSREAHFISRLTIRNPRSEIRDLTPLIDDMRSIKSPREIELMRRAGRLAALAVTEAMRSTEPGVIENHLEAAARYIFALNGVRLEGYLAIIPSGVANTADAHYFFNSQRLTDGDLVLMDYAPEVGYYTSDIGRMWPVNGTYAPWQRELCQFILEYHKAVLQRIRPGVTSAQIKAEADAAMEAVFARTVFSRPEFEKAARRLVETGGGVFSHTVGMAVHDVGRYAPGPLRPGQVFAIDPQLRVPEMNLYMRIEDTVLVTETGIENLTRFAPSELRDIEKTIREKGLVQAYPPDKAMH